MKRIKAVVIIVLVLALMLLTFTSCAKNVDLESFIDIDETIVVLKKVIKGEIVEIDELSESAELLKFNATDLLVNKEVQAKCELPNNIDFTNINAELNNLDNEYVIDQFVGHKYVYGPGFEAVYDGEGYKLKNLIHFTLCDNNYYNKKGEIVATRTTEVDEETQLHYYTYTLWTGYYWEQWDGGNKLFNEKGEEISLEEFDRFNKYKKGYSLFEEYFLRK